MLVRVHECGCVFVCVCVQAHVRKCRLLVVSTFVFLVIWDSPVTKATRL